MVTNEREQHFLAEITLKSNGDFYCLNCLHLFKTKSKLESYKKASENKDLQCCNTFEDTNILGFNQYQKCYNAPSMIDADLESLIKKVDRCKKIILKYHPQQK